MCPSPNRFSIGTWCRDACDPSLGVGARKSSQNQGSSRAQQFLLPAVPMGVQYSSASKRGAQFRPLFHQQPGPVKYTSPNDCPCAHIQHRLGGRGTKAPATAATLMSTTCINTLSNHFPDTDPVVVVHLASWVKARRTDCAGHTCFAPAPCSSTAKQPTATNVGVHRPSSVSFQDRDSAFGPEDPEPARKGFREIPLVRWHVKPPDTLLASHFRGPLETLRTVACDGRGS